MKEKCCNCCAYYRRHYTFDQRKLFRIYCGHCTFQKAKNRKPDAVACDHYSPGQRDEDAFVSKEYLSKQLLEYMLHLELLPEISTEKDERIREN